MNFEEKMLAMMTQVVEEQKNISTHLDRLETRFENLETRLDRLETRVDKMHDEMISEFKAIHEEMDTRFQQVDEKMDTRFQQVDEKMDTRFQQVDEKMDTRFQQVDEKIDCVRREIQVLQDGIVEETNHIINHIDQKLQTAEERDYLIYNAVVENREGINALAKPFILPPIKSLNIKS